ncbi:hypothetical protein SAMN05216323_101619 [Williamwhitmania taraxaci]|uniref:Uncharacterized protein n=1 Tax=Williamwhitmania taraxaci TaxID=1640674 RepID=A0A1G6IIF3_9BACT|nr:hypothetical protein SAMN05216323_101619 [Williamwhitmania taraxaci]
MVMFSAKLTRIIYKLGIFDLSVFMHSESRERFTNTIETNAIYL